MRPPSEGVLLGPSDSVGIPVDAGSTIVLEQIGPSLPLHVNLFALDDYKVRLSAGHSRFQGFHLAPGHLLVSTPPHYQPMLMICSTSPGVVVDLLEPGCDRRVMPSGVEPACTDLLAQAGRDHGLAGHDVHDAVGFWVNTEWTGDGRVLRRPTSGKPGEQVTLLALMDVLVTAATCSAPDLRSMSPRGGGGVKISIRADQRLDDVRRVTEPFGNLASITPLREHPDEPVHDRRALTRVPNYQARYKGVPIEYHEVTVEMTATTLSELRQATGLLDAADAHVVRFAFMEQVTAQLRNRPLLHRGRPTVQGSDSCRVV